MTVILETFDLKTKAYCDVINITSQVQNAIERSGLKNGIVNVHVAGSTGAISTVEYETKRPYICDIRSLPLVVLDHLYFIILGQC